MPLFFLASSKALLGVGAFQRGRLSLSAIDLHDAHQIGLSIAQAGGGMGGGGRDTLRVCVVQGQRILGEKNVQR